MRSHEAAASTFEREEAQDLRGFYLRDGGWKGAGWNQISRRRRKRAEQQQRLLDAERLRRENDEKKRHTPLGRMNDASLKAWNSIPRCVTKQHHRVLHAS
jgi:hypothetical protein